MLHVNDWVSFEVARIRRAEFGRGLYEHPSNVRVP